MHNLNFYFLDNFSQEQDDLCVLNCDYGFFPNYENYDNPNIHTFHDPNNLYQEINTILEFSKIFDD